MIWDLVLRLGGQLRSIQGPDSKLIIAGVDMTAALALAGALGLPPRLAAEFLPDIEAALVAAINNTGDNAEIPEEGEANV